MLFITKTLEDEQYIVLETYKFTVFEILSLYYIFHAHAIPKYRVYWLYDLSDQIARHQFQIIH